jgi:hypothetical protein
MDGAVAVTQCNVPPGSTFIYDFTVCHVTEQLGRKLTWRLTMTRSINQELTGITRTAEGNIQTDFEDNSLSTILTIHMLGSTTRKSALRSPIGITINFQAFWTGLSA